MAKSKDKNESSKMSVYPKLPDPKVLGVPGSIVKAIGVVANALPEGKRLEEVRFMSKAENKAMPEYYGYFERITPKRSRIVLRLNMTLLERASTLIHELAHALDWAKRSDQVGEGHDMGWGCAYSLVYRVTIGEVVSIRVRENGDISYVTEGGILHEAS